MCTQADMQRHAEYNFDAPAAVDEPEMLRCLDALHAGRPYDLPVYDFTSHARSATEVRRVEAAQVRCVQTA